MLGNYTPEQWAMLQEAIEAFIRRDEHQFVPEHLSCVRCNTECAKEGSGWCKGCWDEVVKQETDPVTP